MAKKNRYLISYILNNQPQSVEIESDIEGMTPEQARFHLITVNCFEWPDAFTDVQVTHIVHPKDGAPTPAHHLPA